MTISVSGRLSSGRAPQRGERANRFEESIFSLCPIPPPSDAFGASSPQGEPDHPAALPPGKIFLHYTSKSKMRKTVSMLQGTTLPSAGRVAAERPGWFIYRCKAQMRLIAKRYPGTNDNIRKQEALPRESSPKG